MIRFVKECRREWRRLGVPDAIANEMAADLTADLEEAEAEGASIEEVLGSSAFDPRSFAASWAAERGVSQPPAALPRTPRRWAAPATLAPLAVLASVVVVLIGALMVLAPHPRLFVGSSSSSVTAVPHPTFIGPPPGIAGHANAVANGVHVLGALVLIAGVIAMVAALAWIWRRRGGGGGSGWSPPSAAWPRA